MSERNFGETIKKNLATNGYPYGEDQLNLVEERTENCNTVYSTELAKRGSLIIDPSIIMDEYDKLCLVQSDVYVSPKSPSGNIFDHNHNVLDDFDVKILQTLPARLENFKVTVKVVAPKQKNYLQTCPPATANGGQHIANGGQHIANGGQHIANGGQHIANGGHHIVNGGQHIANDGQHIAKDGSDVVDGSKIVVTGCPVVVDGAQVVVSGSPVVVNGGTQLGLEPNVNIHAGAGSTDEVTVGNNAGYKNYYANDVQVLKLTQSNLNETDFVAARDFVQYKNVVPVSEIEPTHLTVTNEESSPKAAISYLDSVISEHDAAAKHHVNSHLSFDVKIMAIPPKPCSACFAVVIPVVLPKESATSRS